MDCSKGLVNIYWAAPLFNQAEMSRNEKLAEDVATYLKDLYEEDIEFQIFLPQRDAGEITAEVGSDEFRSVIYAKDLEELNKADLMIADFTGRVPDEGTVFETGFAVGRNVPVVGILDDKRSFMGGYPNNMLYKGVTTMVTTLEKSALEKAVNDVLVSEVFSKGCTI